jgi:2-oxoglutarate dehydrogenase E1 component
MYESWLKDPSSVHESWESVFQSVKSGECISVPDIILYYQLRGHLKASLDPLDISNKERDATHFQTHCHHMLSRVFQLPKTTWIGGETETSLTLAEIIERLESAYSGSIGVEVMHVNVKERRDWITKKFETPNTGILGKDDKRILFTRLIHSTKFENFLKKKWEGEKRFSLEGCDVLVPALQTIIDYSSKLGVDSFVTGMPHRGRLNVMANVAQQPLEEIFRLFDKNLEVSTDVKYHLGVYHEGINRASNRKMKLSLLANPSHLEAIYPVVQGKTRAEQHCRGDPDGKRTMSIVVHGDGAFSGQGVVYETLQLSDLPDYKTHGTIHIVVNNQISFTTDPCFARSSRYCTDVAKVVNAPVVHVNADDVEAVINVCRIAAEWRNEYHEDIVIDLVGYRREGHNELDEPRYTQPIMYHKIENHPTSLEKYKKRLLSEKAITEEEYNEEVKIYEKECKERWTAATKNPRFNREVWVHARRKDFCYNGEDIGLLRPENFTGVAKAVLCRVGQLMSSYPDDDFTVVKGTGKFIIAKLFTYCIDSDLHSLIS